MRLAPMRIGRLVPTLALLAALLWPQEGAGQEPGPPPAPPSAPADSVRVEFERLVREQVLEIQRIIEARQADFQEIRERLIQEAEEARRQIELGRQGSVIARRQLEESRQHLEATQEAVDAARREIEAMRREVSRSLTEALELRQDQLRRTRPGMVRGTPETEPRIYVDGVEIERPLPLLLQGQRIVAGIELTELNPQLGRYFDVASGVLVTHVSERSPGADAGLLPGDVIIEVGGEPVGTVQEVRSRFARFGAELPAAGAAPGVSEDLPIRIVREGTERELVIPR